MLLKHIRWRDIFDEIVNWTEEKFELCLIVDKEILKEIEVRAEETLRGYQLSRPNLAKIGSSLTFWIRKLKPISFAENSKARLFVINELVALLLGLSICMRYHDDYTKEDFSIPIRIFHDWVTSLRYNSHSPYGTSISFELLTSQV